MIGLFAAIGAITLTVLAGIAVIVGLDEWDAARKRHRIDSIIDPFTERETRMLVDRYRQTT